MSEPTEIIIEQLASGRYVADLGEPDRRVTIDGIDLSEFLDAIERGVLIVVRDSDGNIIRRFRADSIGVGSDLDRSGPAPNSETAEALRDADEGRGLTRYENFDDFARAMTSDE